MTDLALRPGLDGRLDIQLAGERAQGGDLVGDLATDDGLYTAAALSLLCDRRAEADDLPGDGPGRSGDRRGWWANSLSAIQGDRIGSCLWLRGPETAEDNPMNRHTAGGLFRSHRHQTTAPGSQEMSQRTRAPTHSGASQVR